MSENEPPIAEHMFPSYAFDSFGFDQPVIDATFQALEMSEEMVKVEDDNLYVYKGNEYLTTITPEMASQLRDKADVLATHPKYFQEETVFASEAVARDISLLSALELKHKCILRVEEIAMKLHSLMEIDAISSKTDGRLLESTMNFQRSEIDRLNGRVMSLELENEDLLKIIQRNEKAYQLQLEQMELLICNLRKSIEMSLGD